MSKWISVKEKKPEFHINESGVVCTDLLIFRREEHKTAHMGYAIREVTINASTGDIFQRDHWYDQTGKELEDVSHWCFMPEL